MNYTDDYSHECSMCGKPMKYRLCGMCVSCEQIDNDVPDYPAAGGDCYGNFDGEHCPCCGDVVRHIYSNWLIQPTRSECDNCNWKGEEYYD